MQTKLSHKIDELFVSTHGGIEATVEITFEFDEPDPSVGYRGGSDIVDVTLIEFVVYDENGELGIVHKRPKSGNDLVIFDMVEVAAFDHCEERKDHLISFVCEKLKDERDYIAEEAAIRRREALYD